MNLKQNYFAFEQQHFLNFQLVYYVDFFVIFRQILRD